MGFSWGLPGNDVSAYIYMSPYFKIFFHVAAAWPPLHPGSSPPTVEEDFLSPRLLRAHGSFRAVCYCRMHGSGCGMARIATRSWDFEKDWAAPSSRFCRITSTWSWAWVVDRVGLFGKADFLAQTLAVPRSLRRAHAGAWSGAGVPPAIEGVPHPRNHLWQGGKERDRHKLSLLVLLRA